MASVAILTENLKLKAEIENYLLDANYSVKNTLDEENLSSSDIIIYDMTALQNESLIPQLKAQYPHIPLVALINRGDVQAAVQYMRAGADHVLEVPVNKKAHLRSIQEAFASQTAFQQNQRVIQQAIDLLNSLRIGQTRTLSVSQVEPQLSAAVSQDDVLQVGQLIINLKQEKVFYQKILLELTTTQFRLLTCLSREQGRVVPFEELYFCLHGETIEREPARIALSAHLSYLRAKLSEVGCQAYLKNIRGRGYIIDAKENPAYSHKVNLDATLEQLPIILWTTDHKLRIIESHGAGFAKLRLKPQDVIGFAPSEIFQSDVMRILDAHQDALQGESRTFDQRIEGRIFYVHVQPTFSSHGHIIGCIGFAVDMTEWQDM